MKTTVSKIVTVVISACVAGAILTGCGDKNTINTQPSKQQMDKLACYNSARKMGGLKLKEYLKIKDQLKKQLLEEQGCTPDYWKIVENAQKNHANWEKI